MYKPGIMFGEVGDKFDLPKMHPSPLSVRAPGPEGSMYNHNITLLCNVIVTVYSQIGYAGTNYFRERGEEYLATIFYDNFVATTGAPKILRIHYMNMIYNSKYRSICAYSSDTKIAV